MEKSEELGGFLSSLIETFGTARMGTAFADAIAAEPGVLLVGTDPAEWWGDPDDLLAANRATPDRLDLHITGDTDRAAMVLAAVSSLALDLGGLRGQAGKIAEHGSARLQVRSPQSACRNAQRTDRRTLSPGRPARRLPGRRARSSWCRHGTDLDEQPQHVGLGEALDAPAVAEMQDRNTW